MIRTFLNRSIIVVICISSLLSSCKRADNNRVVITSPIGDLCFIHDFHNGYPLPETQKRLLDEVSFQRACQVYLWSMPLVSMAQWQYAHVKQLGAENGQIVYYNTYKDKLGGLTFNGTTPYVISFIDLNDGSWVVELPKGEMIGGVVDFWQRTFAQFHSGGKYIIGTESADDVRLPEGYEYLKSPSKNILIGFRIISSDENVQKLMLDGTSVYPLSEFDNPNPRGWISPNGKKWQGWHPDGMEYWYRLSDIINREDVAERDRFFMSMLKSLDIEKGKRFIPDESQAKLLKEAVFVGEAMAKANDFHNERLEESVYIKGSNWEYALVCPTDQRHEYYDDLDARAAWFYEAVMNGPDMHGHETGNGQVYMAAYTDHEGNWLDGDKNYVLHIPPKVPAKSFWSLTVYDIATRAMIENKIQRSDISSRMDLTYNEDGSVDLFIGPAKPKNAANTNNWIQTIPGKSWFCYFRLYDPGNDFMVKKWILPDIEYIKNK